MRDNQSSERDLVEILERAAQIVGAVARNLAPTTRNVRAAGHPAQYSVDLAADEAALEFLLGEGFGVHSEESGLHASNRSILVVLDPIDGSSNYSRGIPWFGPALCAVDSSGPVAAVVSNLGTDDIYTAARHSSARRNGLVVTPSKTEQIRDAFIHVDCPSRQLAKLSNVRNHGASAHSLCLVADGTLDAYIDVNNTQAPWDYLAATFIIERAGGSSAVLEGASSYTLGDTSRRRIVAAATPRLLRYLSSPSRFSR